MNSMLVLSADAMQAQLASEKGRGRYRAKLDIHRELGELILMEPVNVQENTCWLQYYNVGVRMIEFGGSMKCLLGDAIDSITHVRDNLDRIESTTASFIADGFNSIVATQSPCILNIRSIEFRILHDTALRSEFRAHRVDFFEDGSYRIFFSDPAYDDIYECPLVKFLTHSPVSFDITM